MINDNNIEGLARIGIVFIRYVEFTVKVSISPALVWAEKEGFLYEL